MPRSAEPDSRQQLARKHWYFAGIQRSHDILAERDRPSEAKWGAVASPTFEDN
jgi:hypothetical protein